MCAKLIKSNPQKKRQWSGGETTELYISPQESEYKKRDFNFRLSTATVDVDESIFTSLNGVSRVLMVLEGRMKLIHENYHSVDLSRFDMDQFEGGWKTRSIGRCVDFNLMLRNGYNGSVEALDLAANSKCAYPFDDRPELFFYAFNNGLSITLDGVVYKLREGDVLHVEESECFNIDLSTIDESALVVVKIL